MGKSLDSSIISHLSNSNYSHIGIIIETTPEILVLHATTDDNLENLNQVILSDLNSFWSPKGTLEGAIVRPNFLSKSQRKLIAKQALHKIGYSFNINSKSKQNIYCTTLISQTILENIDKPFTPKWQNINLPLIQGKYLFPQALFEYPDNELIYQFKEKIHK